MRKGAVYVDNTYAGAITESEHGDFAFQYDSDYLKSKDAKAISLTLPLREQSYQARTIHPFFDGLIPEGWLLILTSRNWKLDQNDRMGLLLAACENCIGNVSIRSQENKP